MDFFHLHKIFYALDGYLFENNLMINLYIPIQINVPKRKLGNIKKATNH